jgi:WD40 repeat protein
LIRTDDFADARPFEGHSDAATCAFFSPDNQRLWSFGNDGSICHWDANTMKMIERKPIPPEYELKSIQEPEGQYALYQRREPANPRLRKMRVMEVASGKFLPAIEEPLPDSSDYWLTGGQLLSVGRYGDPTTLIDITTGKVLRRNNAWIDDRPFLSQDRQFLLANFPKTGPQLPMDQIDLATGDITRPAVAGEGDTLTAGDRVFTRVGSNLTPKKEPTARGLTVESRTLSPDGRRLALVTSDSSNSESPRANTTIRIHDAETLRMLYAIPSATHSINVRFNSDATQLAVAHADGTIERWPLPE